MFGTPPGEPSNRLVLLEFSGVGPEQRFDAAFPADAYPQVLKLDPLAAFLSRARDIPERIALLADHIHSSGVPTVRLCASCSAVALLSPLARSLTQRGVRVSGILAIDPFQVTDTHALSALRRIATNLSIKDQEPAEPFTRASVQALIAQWIDRFLERSGLEAAAQDVFREDLMAKYVNWLDYLLWASTEARPARDLPVRILTTAPIGDPEVIFGKGPEVIETRYESADVPALLHPVVIEDLRQLVS
ncbi:hypothetical protein [Kitasatospora kifunensis]|uniref:Uncharacterized protein n=1 Tax=Kitasatospora kifunensis TaxID=58351 RepID=A0A7W7R7L3_KITKI|nr:hypothetical protein [Kitasatospora kifunensis]MBB4926913.1 hypothetical protein [Kitasatospora kifunensis]